MYLVRFLVYFVNLIRLLLSKGVFKVWEESPEIKTTSRGQQRQVFLFKDCIVLCKLKKDTSMNQDTYTFKNKMKVRFQLLLSHLCFE